MRFESNEYVRIRVSKFVSDPMRVSFRVELPSCFVVKERTVPKS